MFDEEIEELFTDEHHEKPANGLPLSCETQRGAKGRLWRRRAPGERGRRAFRQLERLVRQLPSLTMWLLCPVRVP